MLNKYYIENYNNGTHQEVIINANSKAKAKEIAEDNYQMIGYIMVAEIE